MRYSAHHPITLDHQVIDRLLKQPEVGLVFEHAADGGFVQNTVGLRPRGAHRRAFGAVQNTELDTALVSGQRHGAAHRVHLLHQMTLADAADRRVAAHLAQGLNVVGQQQRFAAHAGAGQRRFGAGMAAADDDHVKFLGIKHSGLSWDCAKDDFCLLGAAGKRQRRLGGGSLFKPR